MLKSLIKELIWSIREGLFNLKLKKIKSLDTTSRKYKKNLFSIVKFSIKYSKNEFKKFKEKIIMEDIHRIIQNNNLPPKFSPELKLIHDEGLKSKDGKYFYQRMSDYDRNKIDGYFTWITAAVFSEKFFYNRVYYSWNMKEADPEWFFDFIQSFYNIPIENNHQYFQLILIQIANTLRKPYIDQANIDKLLSKNEWDNEEKDKCKKNLQHLGIYTYEDFMK